MPPLPRSTISSHCRTPAPSRLPPNCAAVMGLPERATGSHADRGNCNAWNNCSRRSPDAGCIGLSVMTTRLDKMDGDRAWSSPLPSTFASWKNSHACSPSSRRRGAVMQGAPECGDQGQCVRLLSIAHGWFRKPLACSMLTALDLKSQPLLHRFTRLLRLAGEHRAAATSAGKPCQRRSPCA